MIVLKRFFIILIFFSMFLGKSKGQSFYLNISPAKNLHNTNGACGNISSSNDAVVVSGLSNLSDIFALKQIDITFGDCGTGSKNYNNIILRIQAPNGKCTVFFNTGNFLTAASGQHILSFISPVSCVNAPDNLNSNSSRVDSVLNGNYGYFAAFNALVPVNLTDTFNGINPNGIWRIFYTDRNGSSGFPSVDPCISDIKLTFGNPAVIDHTTDGDNCINPIIWDGESFCANTNGKSGSSQMPGWFGPGVNTFSTIGGSTCGWNAANNNDVWIQFTPSSPEVCVSVSGLDENLQSVIVTDSNNDGDNNPCTGAGNGTYWNLVSCPDKTGSVNDIYSGTSGTQRNQNHCFTAIPGVTYYLVVDGNGGAESPFFVKGNFNALSTLPVTLTYFFGKKMEDENILYWQTASEINNRQFYIEYSFNGIDFKYLATIAGNGTSNSIHNYQFVHNYQVRGIIYYRLKQIDFDGKVYYSTIIMIKNEKDLKNNFSIFPNPSKNAIIIDKILSEKTFEIFNIIGNKVLEGIYMPASEIDITQLRPGIYILKIADENIKKFTKE